MTRILTREEAINNLIKHEVGLWDSTLESLRSAFETILRDGFEGYDGRTDEQVEENYLEIIERRIKVSDAEKSCRGCEGVMNRWWDEQDEEVFICKECHTRYHTATSEWVDKKLRQERYKQES